MKNYFSLIILACSFALLGASCMPTNNDRIPFTERTTETTTSSPTHDPEPKNIEADTVVMYDNHYEIPTQLKTSGLIEINRKEAPTPDYIEKELGGNGVRYYRSGKDTFFALLQTAGTMSLVEDLSATKSPVGIWYFSPLSEGKWKPYLEIKPNNSQEIPENSPFHFWLDSKALNVLVIDRHGYSGEGLAKILSSEDYGATWYLSRCFYYIFEDFPEVFAKNSAQRQNFSAYLTKKFLNPKTRVFIYNPKTNSFEGTQLNKYNRTERLTEPLCQNIVVDNNALTKENFSPSAIGDGAKSVSLPIQINPTEPIYNVTIEAETSSTPARMIIKRGENTAIQNIILSGKFLPEPSALQAPTLTVLRDVNFDGYTDIGLTVDGGAKWGAEQYWLFDPKTKKFITNQLTNDLRKMNHNEIRFDTSTERIITNNFIGPGVYKKTVYGIKNGRIVTLEDYEQEPVYKDDQPTGACIETVKKDVRGTTHTRRETKTLEECSGYSGI